MQCPRYIQGQRRAAALKSHAVLHLVSREALPHLVNHRGSVGAPTRMARKTSTVTDYRCWLC